MRWAFTKLNIKYKIPIMLISFLMISSGFFWPNVRGEDASFDIIDCAFNFEMKTATDFYLNVQMRINRATAFGQIYNNAGVNGLATSGDADDSEALGVIKNNLHNSLRNQLIDVFGEKNIDPLGYKPTYQSPYFYEEYNINLTSDYFGINETINPYELINGVLDMGGWMNYNFIFKADHGWNNTYSMNLGENYKLQRAIYGSVMNQIIEWEVRNGNGENPEKEGVLIISRKNPTSDLEEEDITLDFILNSKEKDTVLISNINLKSISLSNYNFLPTFLTNISHVPSDGLRLFVKNGLLSWDEIYQKTVKSIHDEIKTAIETPAVFNQTLNFKLSWDENTTETSQSPYIVNKMDKNPPARMILTDESINIIINQLSSRALFGLVDAGAIATVKPNSINFGSEIENVGYEYNITLQMPENVLLNNKNEYTWNKYKNFSGEILSNNAQKYDENEINSIIEIEVESTDLNLLSIFTGQTELVFGLNLEEEKNYKVTQMPSEFNLPDSIYIEYLCSDALRLCIEEDVFKQSEVDEFLAHDKTVFEEVLKQIIGFNIKGNEGLIKFQESLEWDGNILEMDENSPVITRSYSHESFPIKFQLSITPPEFKIPPQKFTFKGLQNQQRTYRMIFPPGISINSEDTLDKSKVNVTRDGCRYVEIVFSPDEAGASTDVTLTITPSFFFILGLFTPCIVSLMITIILIIVVIMFRRKRKRKGPVAYSPPSQEQTAGYEEEDYYIPPPPGSK